jgi:cytochrome P450
VATTDVRPDLYYDPYDRTIDADPYPLFRRMRHEAPLYYNEEYNFYAVSRFDDVERAYVERETFLSSHGNLLEILSAGIEIPPGTLIYEEPPTHTIHRQLLSRVFTPRAMADIEPMVRDYCARTLDRLLAQGEFDYVQDFARFIPMRVFGMLLGIAEEDQAEVVDHIEDSMRAEPGVPRDRSGGFDTGEFYEPFLDYRYANPGEDLITRLITTEFEDEHGERRPLTKEEALVYITVVAGAGNETTNRLIGWTGYLLGQRPEIRREIAADQSLIPQTIEEVLRFEPSGTYAGRWVGTDTEIGGGHLPAGSVLLCLTGSANRDETVFENPDTFDIHRKIAHHLTFGFGAHFCLGASLARLEGRVALDEVLKRFVDWEVDLDGCVRGTLAGIRGWDNIPVSVG